MVSDIISDSLIRLQNAAMRKHKKVRLIKSKIVVNILKILQDREFVGKVDVVKDGNTEWIDVVLLYDDNGVCKLTYVKRISKPGRRVYVKCSDIRRIKGGRGIGIYSTSRGVLSDKEAYMQKVGGEYLCEIW